MTLEVCRDCLQTIRLREKGSIHMSEEEKDILYNVRKNGVVLVHITTIPETFHFLRGQIAYMKNQGIEVHGVSSPGVHLDEVVTREKIPMHPVGMNRLISPFADLRALYQLYYIFRKHKPHIVHAHTPKGGLLGILAARLARVPVIIYGMRGLPFTTATGLKRKILWLSEFLSSHLAHQVMAVSFSTRKRAIEEGFCSYKKIVVFGKGSSNGVDSFGRFNPDRLPPGIRKQMRQQYDIPVGSPVVGYVGRIVRDKGIIEIEEAWQYLRTQFPELHLLLIGLIESQDPVPTEVLARLQADPRVKFICGEYDMPALYAAMDILILPTYREGLPNTPLEAAAMNLPVVTTNVDGCPEAVLDQVTGLIIPPRDSKALAAAIEKLVANPETIIAFALINMV
jgi:glycosyltransferase involved in cell wall biosynthesis